MGGTEFEPGFACDSEFVESTDDSFSTSRRASSVEAQEPTESIRSSDRDVTRVNHRPRLDQSIAEPLMIALGVEVSRILSERMPERARADDDHPVQALGPARPHESLGVGVAVRRMPRAEEHVHASASKDVTERLAEPLVAIEDRQPLLRKEPVDAVGQVARDLHHELLAWVRRAPDVFDGSCREIDREDRVAPGRVLARHVYGELGDRTHDLAVASPATREGPLLRDEPPVPSQDRLGRDDRGELVEGFSAESDASHREPHAVVVGQSELPAAKLRPEDAVLLVEVVEHPLLVAVQPTGKDDGEGVKDRGHGAGERSGLARPPDERRGPFGSAPPRDPRGG